MALTSREEVNAHGFTSAGPWLGRLIAFRPLVGMAVPRSIRWRKLNSSWPVSMKERALVSQSLGHDANYPSTSYILPALRDPQNGVSRAIVISTWACSVPSNI